MSIWRLLILIGAILAAWILFRIFTGKRKHNLRRSSGNGHLMWLKKTKDYLSITDKTIKYTDKKHTNQVYQLSNITQITKHKLTHKRIAKVILSLMLAAVGVGLAIAGERQSGLLPLAAAAFILSILLFLWALLRRNRYALILETSSGMGEVLVSKKEKFIDELVLTITDVMEKPVEGTNLIAYPKTTTIVNKSYTNIVAGDEVAGDKFENIKNSAIANRSEGASVSNSVTNNYGIEVEKALDILVKHINNYNDASSQSLMEKLRESMSEPEPDRSRVSALWTSLVQILPDVSKVAASIATIAGAVL